MAGQNIIRQGIQAEIQVKRGKLEGEASEPPEQQDRVENR